MKICKRCIQPDSRPGIKFNEEGICYPCLYFEECKEVDWTHRRNKILEIADWAKENSTGAYDCIISVSGGKDSMRQALLARDSLGLNPLLVSTVSPTEMMTDIGAKNLQNLTELGFDIITVEPAGKTYKELMRLGLKKYGNYAKSTELVLYASAPRIAIAYDIKLIFLGENNNLTYGEDAHGVDGGDASNMKNYNTLGGGDLSWMLDHANDVYEHNMIPYRYPKEDEFDRSGVRIIYLGYYFEDFNNKTNGRIALENGLSPRNIDTREIGCLHNFDALDDDYVGVNQMIKFLKFGFGKASDEICEQIRLGDISREEGLALLKEYDGKSHRKYILKLCHYLNISEEEFWNIANTFRSKELFPQPVGNLNE